MEHLQPMWLFVGMIGGFVVVQIALQFWYRRDRHADPGASEAPDMLAALGAAGRLEVRDGTLYQRAGNPYEMAYDTGRALDDLRHQQQAINTRLLDRVAHLEARVTELESERATAARKSDASTTR